MLADSIFKRFGLFRFATRFFSNRKCVFTSPRCCCIFAHLHTSSHHRLRRFLSASNVDWGKRYKRYDLFEYTYLSYHSPSCEAVLNSFKKHCKPDTSTPAHGDSLTPHRLSSSFFFFLLPLPSSPFFFLLLPSSLFFFLLPFLQGSGEGSTRGN